MIRKFCDPAPANSNAHSACGLFGSYTSSPAAQVLSGESTTLRVTRKSSSGSRCALTLYGRFRIPLKLES